MQFKLMYIKSKAISFIHHEKTNCALNKFLNKPECVLCSLFVYLGHWVLYLSDTSVNA